MENIWIDLRYATRILLRSPLFTLASLLTFAVGVGATVAIFAIANSVWFRALPYPQPDRLVALTREGGGPLTGQGFLRLRGQLRSLEGLAAQGSEFGLNLVAAGGAEYVSGLGVSQEYFSVLGARPALGREFAAVEDQPGGPLVVLISDTLWRRHFRARPEVLGESVALGGVTRTIIGVMPPDFQTIPPVDVWTPLRLSDRDNTWNYRLVGRLKHEASVAQARSEFESVWPNVVADLPGGADVRRRAVTLTSYHGTVAGYRRGPLLILIGAVVFLLLVTCANVGGLQLVRATTRMREMAIRAALGGRGRLLRLVLVESLLQSLVGGGLGLLIGWGAVRSVPLFVPERLLGAGARVELDGLTIALAAGLSVATGLLFGLVLMMDLARMERTGLHSSLGASGTRQSTSRSTIRRLRVIAAMEIGLAVVLLVGAGLLIRTYDNLQRVDLGFNPHNVVTASMSFRGVKSQASAADTVARLEQTRARLREMPGVAAAALGSRIPIERGLNLPMEPPDGDPSRGTQVVDWAYVSPQYFEVFAIPIREGRSLDERDNAGAVPVAVVNEAFQRTYLGDQSAIGTRVRLSKGFQGDPVREIVGVIADVKTTSGAAQGEGLNALAKPAPPVIYVPLAQVPERLLEMAHNVFHVNWAVQLRSQDARTTAAVRAAIRDAQPLSPIVRFRTMEEVIGSEVELQRFHAIVVGAFSAVALILATVGVYALMAYSVTQRTQEIGVRMALGARPGTILGQFVREGVIVARFALLVALPGSAALAQTLRSAVWRVEPLDPVTFIGAAGLLILAIMAASLVPALRGARIEPSRALRFD